MDIKRSSLVVKLITFCLIIVACSPIVELPEIKNRSSIKIVVEPIEMERTIIVGDIFSIDTIVLPSGVRETLVDNLTFGTYNITITAQTYGTITDDLRLTAIDLEKKYTLDSAPAQVYSFSCPSDGKFRYNDYFNVRLKTVFSEASLKELIRFDPEIPFEIDSVFVNVGSNNSAQQFRIIPNLYELYNYDSIKVVMNDTTEDLFGVSMDHQLDTTIFIDTTYRTYAVWDQFISSCTPSDDDSKTVSRSEVIDYNYQPTAPHNSDITVAFREDITSASFEKGFSVSPEIAGTFSYSSSRFTFSPADPLPSDTRFTAKLDTSLRFEDGSAFPVVLSWEFQTIPLMFDPVESYPSNGTTMAIRDSAFVLAFNTAIDSASLHSGLTIDPPLESISFALSNSRDTAYVQHSLLELDTEYTLTLDSAITDRHGVPLFVGYFENSNQIVFSAE